MTRLLSNTSKTYKCTRCGSPGNIIREAPNTADVRVKCNSCGFTYGAQDSLDADEAGAIPTGPPKETSSPKVERKEVNDSNLTSTDSKSEPLEKSSIPRTPTFVFITKTRDIVEFCTQRNFKKTAMKWEMRGNYDCYQLSPKKVEAKIDIT